MHATLRIALLGLTMTLTPLDTTDAQQAQRPRDARATRARVDALLARMTLEEKVGQMTQLTVGTIAAPAAQQQPGRIRLDPAKLREAVVTRHVGSILNVLDAALPAEGWHALIRDIQDVATKETRLKVPVLYGVDFMHGANYTRGATIFPHNIALAATFDPAIVRRAAEITAQEAVASGLFWNFAPVLDVGRNPLWPRLYETFGEEAYVAARLGREAVTGMQQSGQVAATMKHYLAYGASRIGRDRTPAPMSAREVREHYLPSFRAAVQAGAKSVMVNSGDIDGEPVHASRYWLTDVLRGELGFRGVVVTDWEDIIFLHTRHKVAPTMRDAVRMAIEAGVDMSMTPNEYGFADELVALVKAGTIPERRIDESVRRILTLKADVGLLDQPYPDTTRVATIGTPASRDVARRAAREAVTLLKNEGGILPLAPRARVMVAGPAANSPSAVSGGWTWTWQGADEAQYPAGTPTLLDAIRKRAGEVRYVGRAGFAEPTDADIEAAAQAARGADVAVVALGESGYAEWIGDLADLTLPSPQLRLARAVQATGTPTVIVLLEGRPRIIRDVADGARGVVLGYWPGTEGAEAIAEVLFGEVNPSGRLPFTYPKHPNLLVTYDHKFVETTSTGYARESQPVDVQWPFGHGLSYTTFAYGDLQLDKETLAPGERITVRVTVRNTGARAGDESVLLYTRQHYASLQPSLRRLRGFERVSLAPGASTTVSFTLGAEELSYVGRDGRDVLEPGAFDVMVGGQTRTFTVRGAASGRGARAGRATTRRRAP